MLPLQYKLIRPNAKIAVGVGNYSKAPNNKEKGIASMK